MSFIVISARRLTVLTKTYCLRKLSNTGVGGKRIQWIRYFRHETHVAVDGVYSRSAKAIFGIPQGTVLGPFVLFFISMALQIIIGHSTIKILADNSKIQKVIWGAYD